jgi:hypothetical protein
VTSRLPTPFFPSPPAEYSQQYFSQLVRSFAVFAEQVRNPGPVQASSLVLPTLPTSATGLAPGTVWNDAGTLKIVP